MVDLGEEVKKELGRSHSIYEIKGNLVKRGFLEKDVDNALRKIVNMKVEEKTKNNKILSIKEFFDRLGHGFASQQFINILFLFSGGSYFLLGIINGIKTALSYMLSGVLKEYSKFKHIGKGVISVSGIIYGFSFLGIALGVMIQSPTLFALSVLIGSIGIISHGDIYTIFYNGTLKNEKRENFLRFISYFGIIITAIAILLSGLILNIFSTGGQMLVIQNINIKLYGYLLTFELTAIMFILSGYLLSFIDEAKDKLEDMNMTIYRACKNYFRNSAESTKLFTRDPKIFLLTIAIVSTTVIQILGNSYYGVFIYENFKNDFLKGFMNVAVVFVIALIASISGTLLSKRFSKSLGEAPMLVFGTLLIALLPFTIFFNAKLYSIGLATALSVVGGAIVGVAQGLIAQKLMSENDLETYFSSLGFISIIPTILIVSAGAFVAQIIGLQKFFLILAVALAAVIMPIYFTIVLIVDAEYRKYKDAK